MTMLDGLDTTNLLALHVLLEERNVTRAARRLGITQSSMSHRLARLRETLQDPLFTRSSDGLLPTPRAESVALPLREALHALEAAVAPPEAFNPKESRYAVSIAMPDVLTSLAPSLVAEFAEEAPLMVVQLSAVGAGLTSALAKGFPVLAVAPTHLVDSAMMTRPLGEVRFGVVGRRGHRALRGRLTISRWLEYPHVIQRLGNDQVNTVEAELVRLGLQRRIGLEAPSFLAGLFVVAASDLLMNAPIPLVNEAATKLGLITREAPLKLPRVRFSLCWHERFQADPAHRWARERVFETARRAFHA